MKIDRKNEDEAVYTGNYHERIAEVHSGTHSITRKSETSNSRFIDCKANEVEKEGAVGMQCKHVHQHWRLDSDGERFATVE